ncbi:MAG TPA: hypothetical protein VGE77_11920 [Nocardioides sp.]
MNDSPRASRLERLRRFTPSRASLPGLALGTAALVVAASSGAVAATVITGAQIADETITTKDVKNNSLSGADIGDSTLVGADVKNETLSGADIGNGTIYVSDLSSSALKPLLRINGYETFRGEVTLANGTSDVLTLECPAGKLALNTTAFWNGSNDAIQTLIAEDGTYAAAYPDNGTGSSDTAIFQLTCATASY